MNAHACRRLVLSLAVFASPAIADVYKCSDASGKIAYQDSPCGGAAKGWTEQSHEPAPADVPKTITRSVPAGTPLPERSPAARSIPPPWTAADARDRPGRVTERPKCPTLWRSPSMR